MNLCVRLELIEPVVICAEVSLSNIATIVPPLENAPDMVVAVFAPVPRVDRSKMELNSNRLVSADV